MLSTATADELMAVVTASPAAVAAHDKQRWLSMWARNHVIEDPVGSRPVLGGIYDRRSGDRVNGPLSRFWDTFIAANDISFDVAHDFVEAGLVVRDVVITTTLPSGVQVVTPAHLEYELVDEDNVVKVRRMAAHWEVAPVFAQLMKPGLPYLRAMTSNNARMLRYLGVGGTARFVAAIRSVGRRGKDTLRGLAERANHGDERALEMFGGIAPLELDNLIASGDTVTALCTVDRRPALVVATFNRKTLVPVSIEVYRKAYRRALRSVESSGM